MYLIGYCVGNIIGPQVFRPKDEPRYVPAEITIIVCWVSTQRHRPRCQRREMLTHEQGVCLIDLGLIYMWCKYQNKKKAKIRAQPGYVKLENQEFLDLTDRENPEFTYTV